MAIKSILCDGNKRRRSRRWAHNTGQLMMMILGDTKGRALINPLLAHYMQPTVHNTQALFLAQPAVYRDAMTVHLQLNCSPHSQSQLLLNILVTISIKCTSDCLPACLCPQPPSPFLVNERVFMLIQDFSAVPVSEQLKPGPDSWVNAGHVCMFIISTTTPLPHPPPPPPPPLPSIHVRSTPSANCTR